MVPGFGEWIRRFIALKGLSLLAGLLIVFAFHTEDRNKIERWKSFCYL
jgi:hypothetical protein